MTNFGNIPGELKQLNQWVVRNGKIPVNPHTGDNASSKDPSTWGAFNQCLSKIRNYDGIGFEFNDNGLVGIDIDHCINEDGHLSEYADLVYQWLNSYTEISPSGTGLHIFIYGDIPVKGRKHTEKGIELYKSGRYFTMTGNVFGDLKPIERRELEIKSLYDELFPQVIRPQFTIDYSNTIKPEITGDCDLLDKIRASKQGSKFNKLYCGDISEYPSASEADIALCNMLAFWCAGDASLMDRIFRSSGLMRKKWDEKHGELTYGQITISEAICKATSFYTPKSESQVSRETLPSPSTLPQLTNCAEIEIRKIDWLWSPYFPKNELSLILGEAGSGKTFLALKMSAMVTVGKEFWNENPLIEKKPGVVFFLSGEDSAEATLKPRFSNMNGDESRIYFITNQGAEPITFNSPILEGWIKEYKPSLVIFDPIQGYLDKNVDANNQIQIRKALIGVKALAVKYDFTPICIIHPNKDKRMGANDRASGSKDFVNFARSVVVIGRDADDPELILMGHSKSNLSKKGETLSFSLEIKDYDEHNNPISGDIRYEGTSLKTPDQIISNIETKGRESPAMEEAIEFLVESLRESPGKLEVAEIKKQAKEIGINYKTLQRARDEIGLKAKKGEGNCWYWVEDDGESITIEH